MTQYTFGYSDSEDRVWLSGSDGSRYWLTRRLLAALHRITAVAGWGLAGLPDWLTDRAIDRPIS